MSINFIAEVSSNHSRDIARSLEFVDVAADAGCDALALNIAFNVDGLKSCRAQLSCTRSTDAANSTSFYFLNSIGQCRSGDLNWERVINVSAYIQ